MKDRPFQSKIRSDGRGSSIPLVAYNINLKQKDLPWPRDCRKIRFKDGGFPHVRAMGVDLKERGMVQVSMN